jgi:GxxExxY protein
MKKEIDDITAEIIDAAILIHRIIGPGLLEKLYLVILMAELRRRGLKVQRHREVPIHFNGMTFRHRLKVDLIVEDCVVVELKSVEKIAPVHQKQLLTYLRLMNLQVGLLINFGDETLKAGLRRVVNNYTPPASPAPPRLRVNQSVESGRSQRGPASPQ